MKWTYFASVNQHLHDFIKYVLGWTHKLKKLTLHSYFSPLLLWRFYTDCVKAVKNSTIAESIMETKYNRDMFSCQISVGSFQFNNWSTLYKCSSWIGSQSDSIKHSMDIMSCFMKYEKITIIYGVQWIVSVCSHYANFLMAERMHIFFFNHYTSDRENCISGYKQMNHHCTSNNINDFFMMWDIMTINCFLLSLTVNPL